jgi:hypothetical protein
MSRKQFWHQLPELLWLGRAPVQGKPKFLSRPYVGGFMSGTNLDLDWRRFHSRTLLDKRLKREWVGRFQLRTLWELLIHSCFASLLNRSAIWSNYHKVA